jgi:CRP-like cAMP-binding protein
MRNLLLAALPREDQQRLLADCEQIELTFDEILIQPGKRLRHAYFPTAGFISLLTPIDTHSCLEVGMIGDEGMFGSSLSLGVDLSPLQGLVQGAGTAWRVQAEPFRRALLRSPPLQILLNRYIYIQISQLALAAACTRFHTVEARLARWLLMTGDRAHGGEFELTHEMLAHMLGVRRVGVTLAASALRRRGLIQYSRGRIRVLDRRALESASCACYRAGRRVYQQTLGGARH